MADRHGEPTVPEQDCNSGGCCRSGCFTCRVLLLRNAQPAFLAFKVYEFNRELKRRRRNPPPTTASGSMLFDRTPTKRGEFCVILPTHMTPDQLRQRNNDPEAAVAQDRLTREHAQARQERTNANRRGMLGALAYPPMTTFTGAAHLALCWQRPPNPGLIRQNDSFCSPTRARNFPQELTILWQANHDGHYWDWKDPNSICNPLKHRGRRNWSTALIVWRRRASDTYPQNAPDQFRKTSRMAPAERLNAV